MLRALHAGKEKPSVYYSQAEKAHSDLYAVGTILAPQHPLHFFSGQEWADDNYKWRTKYKKLLKSYLEAYEQEQPETQLPQKSDVLPSTTVISSFFSIMTHVIDVKLLL
jgi:hypothetical protein